ncbi:VacJ family lipoprotein [Crenothrix sp.]|uniref:MlaA family lipoprotein n=1 Tax=Crenothrix sp. TaxID=3100433 RepID=UPI00374DDE8B
MNTHYNAHCNRTIQKFSLLILAVASVTLVGCATTHPGQSAASQIDPYENINRKIYSFNDKVDDYVAEPIASTYKKITPQVLQTGVFNFFNNLKNINVVLNDLLQAKFDQSAQDTGRFLMNSTVGIGGLFDVAKKVGLEQHEEDFEQTLAVWGVPQGTYLVFPLLGPVTTRGIPGAIFDTAANPASYVGAPVQLVSLLNTRANAEGSLKFIDEAALDPYVFTRESFLQWRKHLATDGKDQDTDPTGYGEDLLDDETTDIKSKSGAADAKTILPTPTANTTKKVDQTSPSYITPSFGTESPANTTTPPVTNIRSTTVK